ncbi:hypothetical protein D3C81_1959680 [compost metagenome]
MRVFWRSTWSWPNICCSSACWLSSSGISISSIFMWPLGSTMMFGAGARRTVSMPSLTVIFGLPRSARWLRYSWSQPVATTQNRANRSRQSFFMGRRQA